MNENSDPLPYTQVDRAVKPKAALLAGAVGISPQHAMGSLVEFWDLNGDPRELERLVTEGKTEVLLSALEVVVRFKLASGVMIDPSLLVSLGLLEHRGDIFRVRGMSRYFEPIIARLEKREKGRAGGLASAAARKAKTGSARPEKPLDLGSNAASTTVEPPPNQKVNESPIVEFGFDAGLNAASTTVEPARSSGQRSAVISVKELLQPQHEIQIRTLPKEPPDKFANGQAFWAWVQFKRHEVGCVMEDPPHHQKLASWWSVAMLELNGDPTRLEAALYRFADDPFWEKATPPMPFNAFAKDWRKYVPQKTAA